MTEIGTKRGKYQTWTKADHDRLIAFVREHGDKFDVIALELGRTPGACRNRAHRYGPPDMIRTRAHRLVADLTPEQVAEANRLRSYGRHGRMEIAKMAKLMGVRPVQLQRLFAPHEIERKRYVPFGQREYVTNQSVTVPPDVLVERDRAYDRPRFCAAELLGDPPLHRSALGKKMAGLSA